MKILNEINSFYYHMSLHELQLMNGADALGGLSYNSMLYINVIEQMEHCTVSKIAKALGVTKPAVTLKVNELKRQGCLRKTQSETDKRVHYLTLSPEMERTFGVYDEVFTSIEAKLKETYTEGELDLFSRVLQTISSCEWRKQQTI